MSRHCLVLLVIGLHTLPDLFHNLRSVYSTLRLEIIAFRIFLFPYYDNLENDRTSASSVSHLLGEVLTYPESLRVPPTNFTSYNHTKRYPACLDTAIEQCLSRLSR